ncbi:MAG: hypothetical protein QOH21_621 [Acidobacteriota bacterium]|jgi:pimeloyl-ACP methyl ester carboxylesterase|nr:hypothetical protein [Acidobacteriota bacterium]
MPTTTKPLNGSAQPVDLGFGYALRAPGLRGTVTARDGRQPGTRAAETSATEALDEAFRHTDVQEARTIELAVTAAPLPPAAAPLRTSRGDDAFELDVPAPGPGRGQIVMASNEAGAIHWILPEPESEHAAVANNRDSGPRRRFRIPREIVQAPLDGQSSRGLLTWARRKILKVLVYPLTDPIVGAFADHYARQWEEANRPYGVRWFTPQDYDQPHGRALTAADWKTLAGGRTLLFVHGTFSTAHSGFAGIDRAKMQELSDRYDGRMIAFNHFTLSDAPDRNVARLLEAMPPGLRLPDVDIICHSRGGLVARTLAENPTAFDIATERIDVKRIVFVAVPNNGTLLANPTHMVQMIDRLTTILNVIPTNFVTEFLEGMITAVKVIGHGGLKALDGLAAMNPDTHVNQFLRKLNSTGTKGAVRYFAMTSDYEPVDAALRSVTWMRRADAVIDRVFEDAANDLVVPTLGVYDTNGSAYFPLGTDVLLPFDRKAGVIHTAFFQEKEAQNAILNWLR